MKNKFIFLTLVSVISNSYCLDLSMEDIDKQSAELENIDTSAVHEVGEEFTITGTIFANDRIIYTNGSDKFYIKSDQGINYVPFDSQYPFKVESGIKGKFTLKKTDIISIGCVKVKIIKFEEIKENHFQVLGTIRYAGQECWYIKTENGNYSPSNIKELLGNRLKEGLKGQFVLKINTECENATGKIVDIISFVEGQTNFCCIQ